MKTSKPILAMAILLLVATTAQAQGIISAATSGHLEKVKELVEKDPKLVNAKDASGRTPLHWACRGVHFEVLKYLLEKGADVNAKTNNGDAPLHYAVLSGNINIVKQLLDHGAYHSIKNSNSDTPLNIAVATRSKDLMEILLEKGAEYDDSGVKALNMLQISARNGFEKMFKILVEKEGDRLFADKEKNKWTMQDAITGGSMELVNILVDRKIPIEKKADIYGWTVIHYAANNGRLPMIEYLVKNEIDINKRTKGGETAYNLAEKRGDIEALDLIVKLGGKKDPVKFPVLKGKYVGQKPPGVKPEIFAPGIISRPDLKELTLTFSPDDREIFFYRVLAGNHSKIYTSRIVNGMWNSPEEFSITAAYSATLPFIALDNQKMFFLWNNPQHPYEVWVTERIKEGWSDPKYAGPGFCLSQTREGDYYITEVPNGDNDRRTYLSKVTIDKNRFTHYERIDFPDQTGGRAHPCVAPDGSYIIFDEGGGDHIQISFKKKDGTWGKALDLTKYGFEPLTGVPTISRDGKYLFFKLGCRGQFDIGHGDTNRDIWWVDIKAIEDLRPKGISS